MDVELGFVKAAPGWKLLRHRFPSKVGGRPAWLNPDPKHVPGADELSCGKCGNPTAFLLQAYCPIEDRPECFHRTVYVFVCRDPACSLPNDNANFVVFRCQMPRLNPFYSAEPPAYDEEDQQWDVANKDDVPFCVVCGGAGVKRCSRCSIVNYCCRAHQVIDWQAGHKQVCPRKDESTSGAAKFLLPEYELEMEMEPDSEQEPTAKSQDECMRDYNEIRNDLLSSGDDAAAFESISDNDFEEMAGKDDKQCRKFISRIQREQKQVFRYQIGGDPLWVSSQHIPTREDIPACPCGAQRQFEFQILPQLLNNLQLDCVAANSIDWGILTVYTCSGNHCSTTGLSYHPEFLWKQDFSK